MSQQSLSIAPPLDLARTLTMGLSLRWRKEHGGWFSGAVDDKLVMLRQAAEDAVEFRTSDPEDSDRDTLRTYLGLDRDATRLSDTLSRCDPRTAGIVAQYPGMHVLRPEPWECLITCVCSPGQRVHRLSSDIERLSEYHGKRLSLDGVTRYSFPKAERIAQMTVQHLSQVALRMPRRAEYVHHLAKDVASGELNLHALAGTTHAKAKECLTQHGGVTSQVADCVLLFSLDKYDDGVLR